MHWYKRDPDAALGGMSMLTMEERGAYNGVIDLYYSEDGQLRDDDYIVAKRLNCDPRLWRRLKIALFQKQKLTINSDGCLVPNRGEKTLSEARSFSEVQQKRVRSRWEVKEKSGTSSGEVRGEKSEKPIENKEPPIPAGNTNTSTSTSTTTTTKKERKQSAHPIPDDWIPKTESVQKAQALGFNPREIHREAEKFKYHARENDRRAVRWDDAFNRWMVNAAGYANKRPPEEKREFYPALPGSPQFIAWKTYWTDTRNPMVRELKQRELEGRAFKFEAVWPPTYAQQEAAE